MTLEKARQAILEMREATVNDPSMLELSEAFLSMLEANSLGSKPN
jgi:hypothetical protein